MSVVSTQTPEGEPARCPTCGARSLVAPSAYPTTDAPCPACGSLLWLSGDPGREAGRRRTPDPAERLAEEMERAIRRGGERLREMWADSGPPWGGPGLPAVPPPVRAELRLREVTDPAEVRALEEQFAATDGPGGKRRTGS